MSVGPKMRVLGLEYELEMGPLTRALCEAMAPLMTFSVTKYTNIRQGMTAEDESKWFDKVLEDATTLIWAIFVTIDGTRHHAGNSGIHHIDTPDMHTGIILHMQDLWGNGIAKYAHLARTLFAVDVLDALTLKSEVALPNVASWKALEKVGYFHTGTDYRWRVINGVRVPAKHYLWVNPEETSWNYFFRGLEPTPEQLVARERAILALDKARQMVEFA